MHTFNISSKSEGNIEAILRSNKNEFNLTTIEEFVDQSSINNLINLILKTFLNKNELFNFFKKNQTFVMMINSHIFGSIFKRKIIISSSCSFERNLYMLEM